MIVSDEVSRREGWTNEVFQDLQVKAELGRYRIRGFSTFQRIAHFDDIIFIPRYIYGKGVELRPADVSTETVLGTRYARNAISISTPVYITGMSYGALSRSAKTALAKGAATVGTATCTGDGGMLTEERKYSTTMIYKVNASRYGVTPQDMISGDADHVLWCDAVPARVHLIDHRRRVLSLLGQHPAIARAGGSPDLGSSLGKSSLRAP